MKRCSILLLFSVFLFPLVTHAQTRGIGAAALNLDDSLGHLVTIEAPRNPSLEWTQWSETTPPFIHLTWSMPVPPANGAQSGFLYSGPLGGSVVPQLAYWLPPHQTSWSGDGNNGGFAGAWDYAGEGQLGLINGHTTTPSYLPIWSNDTSLGTSSLKDANDTVSTTEAVNFTGGMNVTGTTNINTTGTATTSIGDLSNNVFINGSTVDLEDSRTGVLKLNASATGSVTLGNANSPIFLPQGEYNQGVFDDTGSINIHSTAGGSSLDHNSYFLNFVDGSGNTRGSVKGQSNVDLLESPSYDGYIAASLVYTILVIVYVAGSYANTIAAADIFEAPVALIEALIFASQIPGDVVSAASDAAIVAAESIEAGVQYTSSGADYAEYLRRADPSEQIYPGDVVGVKDGMISKNTEGAQSIFAVSTAPIVLGNEPPKDDEANYNRVGFLGQVMVKVRGAVHPGDFIMASGQNDGLGIAVAEDKITPQEFTQVIGRSWTSSDGADGLVKVAVGLSAKDMSDIVSRQETEIAAIKTDYQTQIASMNTRFSELEQAMTETDPVKKQAFLAQAQAPQVQQMLQQPVAQPLAAVQSPAPRAIVSKPVGSSAKATPTNLVTSQTVAEFAKRFSSITPAQMKSLTNVQQTQSFSNAMQSMKDNIRKILLSSDTRQSKSDRIKEFLLNPITDPATRAAIYSCATSSIQTVNSMVKTAPVPAH